MSFSAITKDELARVVGSKNCCRLSELAALIKMDGSVQISGLKQTSLNIVTENAAVARKIFKLLKNLFGLSTEILVRRKIRLRKNNVYLVRIPPQPAVGDILNKMGVAEGGFSAAESGIKPELVQRDCCGRAYLRGAFLGGGSVNNPEGTYHLEIITDNLPHAQDIAGLMQRFGLPAKVSPRKNWHVVYLKGSEQIVECLNHMGAHSALLDFENVRIYKDMRNQVNRLVNCETANLNKTVNAAVRQLDNIKYLAETIGLSKLPKSLREAAELRLQYPDVSLKELGELWDPPVGKSGVNHRMRKLERLAEQVRSRKGNNGS
ncbi:DNA-binding protein WhiA [Desulforamulus aquiferis]|uniref:Probable cell division protein WhiA n=1 Tax=Desulforamulus aquiferis TaxID=1397668 RepID=A0AAW7ZF49_9FIRM|nr:DNA-binding protein WhiA [Desulforamulus aquiferis]MDO7787918.1 DNA-binding protein WhiA [Desulforamulus aquiferis]